MKRVYQSIDGSLHDNFDSAKEKDIQRAEDMIGAIMDGVGLVRDLPENPSRQKIYIHNFLTDNADMLINALSTYLDADAQAEEDFADET